MSVINAATTEVGIHHIQKQVDNCDSIVSKIDIIVPKLYKVRQQALAQKEYINDASRLIINKADSFIATADATASQNAGQDKYKHEKSGKYSNGTADIIVFDGTTAKPANGQAFVNGDYNNTKEQRSAIQSLYKYKHNCGTSTHFTTEQIGTVDDLKMGLTLKDVDTILDGLSALLSANNKPTKNENMKKILLTGTAANTPTVTAEDDASGSSTSKSLIDTAAQASNPQQYKADTTEGFVSSLNNAHIDNTGGTAEKNDFFVGFGLT